MPPKKSTSKRKPYAQPDEFRVRGEQLVTKVKSLIQEGNVRRISILDSKDNVIVEFPLTLGIAAAVIAPVLAALGALTALLTECTIKVERKKSKKLK
ncbi:MAG: DUF4342 domain-containing protein [Candidatus Roizmanbacteria bacterium]|nr:DUF4342 domain-containing protein [Candidatus Roizmanbacteria bacterium]